MTRTLQFVEAALEPMVEVADSAEEMFNAEWPPEATDDECAAYTAAAGADEVYAALERVCEQLKRFRPGCMLP